MNKYLIIGIILGILNLIPFIAYGIDKAKAIKKSWRIPEATLLTLAVIGPLGALLGMLCWRHKIRKPKFYITVPLLLIIEIAAAVYLMRFI